MNLFKSAMLIIGALTIPLTIAAMTFPVAINLLAAELIHHKPIHEERIGILNRIYSGFQKYLDWKFLRKEVGAAVLR